MKTRNHLFVFILFLYFLFFASDPAIAIVVRFGQDTVITEMDFHSISSSGGGIASSEGNTVVAHSYCAFNDSCWQDAEATMGVTIEIDKGCWKWDEILQSRIKLSIEGSANLIETEYNFYPSGEIYPGHPANTGTYADIDLYYNGGFICSYDSYGHRNCSYSDTMVAELYLKNLQGGGNEGRFIFRFSASSSASFAWAGCQTCSVSTGHADVTINKITIEFLGETPPCPPEDYYPEEDKGPDPKDPNKSSGDPVNVVNGNMYIERSDLIVASPGLPFTFVRTYNSISENDGPMGVGWTHDFNIKLTPPENIYSLVFIRGEKGRGHVFQQITPSVFQHVGGLSKLTTTAEGFLWEKKNKLKYFFDPNGRLQKIQDRNSNTLFLNYDEHGNLTAIQDTVGRTYQLTYDTNRRINSISDPSGRTVLYQYDSIGNLTKVVDPMGKEETYEYNDPLDPHNVTKQNINNSFIFTYSYDAFDRCIYSSGPNGEMSNSYDYSSSWTTAIADANGFITDKYSDSYGNIMWVNYPDGVVESNSLDSFGNLTDSSKITPDGTLLSAWYALYDERGNATDVFHLIEPCSSPCEAPRAAMRAMAYDQNDNLISLTDELGRISSYEYDGSGNLTRVINPDGTHSSYTHNSRGQVLTFADTGGNATTFTYDTQGNLISATNPEGDSVTYSYDLLGRTISKTDPRGKTTSYQYDSLNRIVKVTDALAGHVDTVHEYAGLGSLKDQNNNTTAFHYNTTSQVTSVTDATGHSNSFSYDLNGNLASRTDYNGNTTTFIYDNMNRPTSVIYPGNSQVTFAFDLAGQIIQMIDSTGTSSYAHDALGKLKSYTNGYGLTVALTYDDAGNLITLTYPGNKTVTYIYDNMNRLVQVTDWAGRQTSYTYDLRGFPTHVSLPNGAAVEFDYDDAGRIISISNLKGNQNVISYTYLLDPDGNIIEETSDPVFNIALQPRVSNFTYGTDNRLLTVDGAPVTYDLNGNMLTKGNITYQYDYENRLKSAVGPEGAWEYTYDGKGNRTSIKHNGIERRFMLNPKGMTSVLAEYDGNNNPVSYYIYGIGLLYKVDASGNPFYYHYNATGHTVAMTDSAGAVVNRYAYTPFGELASREETIINPFRYVGNLGVMDDDNGLLYMRARYYESSLGRFITKDPLGFAGGENVYRYVSNNPVSLIDPLGLCSKSVSDYFWEGIYRDLKEKSLAIELLDALPYHIPSLINEMLDQRNDMERWKVFVKRVGPEIAMGLFTHYSEIGLKALHLARQTGRVPNSIYAMIRHGNNLMQEGKSIKNYQGLTDFSTAYDSYSYVIDKQSSN